MLATRRDCCTFLQCTQMQSAGLEATGGTGHTGEPGEEEVGRDMKRVVSRMAALIVAVGLAVGASAGPASADTSWGYFVKPSASVDR